MKKVLSVLAVLTIMAVSLMGCSSMPKHFTGEWKFSSVVKVEILSDASESELNNLKTLYGAETEEEIENNAKAKYIADKTFENFYLKFARKNTFTLDPFANREATWVFYKTDENKGFISFYTELDASEGNPDPVVCPDVTYNAESDTMNIVISNYGSLMITLELTR